MFADICVLESTKKLSVSKELIATICSRVMSRPCRSETRGCAQQPLKRAKIADKMDESGGTSSSVRGGLPPEASRLFRVYRTIANMLEKRGYMITREMREMTPASFVAKFGEYPSRESLTVLVVSSMRCSCCWYMFDGE